MNIEQKVKQTICDCLCVEPSEVENNSVRLIDLGAESIDLLDLEFQLDKKFDNKLINGMIVSAETTVQDVIDFVKLEIGSVA
jgi:acyl carrier protein